MRVVEEFSAGYDPDAVVNEDVLVSLHDFAGVIDGSSLRTQIDGVPAGKFVSSEILSFLKGWDPTRSGQTFLAAVSSHIGSIKDSKQAYPIPLTGGASFAIYNARLREVWRLGSAWMVIDGVASAPAARVADAFGHARSVYLNSVVAQGYGRLELIAGEHDAPIVDRYEEALWRLGNVFGSEYGFGVVNGDQIATPFLEVVEIGPDVRSLVLATDGYLSAPLDLPSAEKRVSDLRSRDPLLFMEEKSPKGIAPGRSWFDDRTYIELAL